MVLPGRTVAQGNPPSPNHQIDQELLGDWMEYIETVVGGSIGYYVDDLADLPAASTVTDGLFGMVLIDSTEDNRGVYQEQSDAWVKVASLPYGFDVFDAPVTSVAGKTGAVTLAKADVGLGNVDNTADAAKPVSTATQTALDLKAPLASPTFTGDVDMSGADSVTVPTPTADAHAATKAYADSLIGDVDGVSEFFGATVTWGHQGDVYTLTNNALTGANAIWDQTAATVDSTLVSIDLLTGGAGTVTVMTGTYDAGDITVTSVTTVDVASGAQTIYVGIPVASGEIVGIVGEGVIARQLGSESFSYYTGHQADAEVDDVVTAGSSNFVFGVSMLITDQRALPARTASDGNRLTIAEAAIDAVEADILTAGGATGLRGFPADIDTQTPTGTLVNTYNFLDSEAMAQDGTITQLRVWVDSDTTFIVRSYIADAALAASTGITVRNEQAVTLTTGFNTVSVSVGFRAGDYIGIFARGGELRLLSGRGARTYWFGGRNEPALTTFDLVNKTDAQYLFELSWTAVDAGLQPDVTALRSDVAALQAGVVADAYPTTLGDLAPAQWLFLGGAGQSNMAGSDTAITTRTEYGAKGYADQGDTLLPFNSSSAPDGVGGDEYPGFGAARYLRERIMWGGGPSNRTTGSQIVLGRAAQGGTVIADMDKPSTLFTDNLDQLSDAKTEAGSNGFRHLGQMFYQGEADAIAGTTKADYKAALIQFATDYDTDSKAAVAGAYDRPTFCAQVTSALHYATALADGWAIAMAQFEAAQESDLIALVGPFYHLGWSDDRHQDSQGYRHAGAYFARAAFAFAAYGVLPEPLMAVDWYTDGSDIVLLYNKPGLTLDVTQVPPQAQSGFLVEDGSATNVPVLLVTASGNEVRLTCDGTPATGWRWSYGEIEAVDMAPYEGGAGNLRDSAGAADVFEDLPLHNWAALQEGTL